MAAHRRRQHPRDGDPHARRDGRRRDPRPAGRRLRALQHRCALARAALREDALRQRAAGARLPRGLPRDRHRALRGGRAHDARLHARRAADARRRLRLRPRRGHRGRGGPLLRLGPRRVRGRARRGGRLSEVEAAALADAWDVTPGGNWEGRSILHRDGRPMRRCRSCSSAARAALLGAPGRVACVRRATRSSWRPGTGSRCARWPRARSCSARSATAPRWPARFAFIRERLLRGEDRLWRTSRDGASHTPAFAEDYVNLADGLLAAYAALGRRARPGAGGIADGSGRRRVLGRCQRHASTTPGRSTRWRSPGRGR